MAQGQCGACWAFSTAETVESEWKFQGNYLWEFSPQQVASCTTSCDGCGGGNQILGFEYLEGVVGLGSEWFAPYTQSMYETCETARCTESCSDFSMADLEIYSSLTGPYATVTGTTALFECIDLLTGPDPSLVSIQATVMPLLHVLLHAVIKTQLY